MSGLLKWWAVVGALAAAGLAGCGKDEGQAETGASAPASPAPAVTAPAVEPPTAAATPATEAALPPNSALAVSKAAGLPDTFITYGCYSCHDVDGARIGPPLRAMVGLYRNNPQALDTLTQKVLRGGGGVWGPTPMIAHPHLTAEQVQPLIEAILKLK